MTVSAGCCYTDSALLARRYSCPRRPLRLCGPGSSFSGLCPLLPRTQGAGVGFLLPGQRRSDPCDLFLGLHCCCAHRTHPAACNLRWLDGRLRDRHQAFLHSGYFSTDARLVAFSLPMLSLRKRLRTRYLPALVLKRFSPGCFSASMSWPVFFSLISLSQKTNDFDIHN
jgi:hypothetical protein